MIVALLAAAVVGLAELTGRRGVDLAASVFRVDRFRHDGFALWDFSWFGGHWTLGYSVLYPPLAAAVGVAALAVASAAVAAWSFDALIRDRLAAGRWPASVLFAVGTVVPAAIGQMPFLTGEAFGLAGLVALDRDRRVAAPALGLLAALTSPLAGAFVALAAAAWAIAVRCERRRRWVPAGTVVAASLVPTAVTALLFPGEGPMPYPFPDFFWELVVALALALLAGRAFPVVRAGAVLVMAATVFAEVVPSALGGNVGRIEDVAALPLAVGLAWSRARLLLPAVAVPLALSQWAPAWGALTYIPGAPSTEARFYRPLEQVLARDTAGGPVGRVEVVPTAYHWEAAYVAPTMPLARGWERQLDESDNPLFYRSHLAAGAYRAWLVDNGVRFVALPSAPLDMAGRAEGALVASGRVAGLGLVWRSPTWRLYQVDGSPGIAAGPARLVSADGTRVVLDASGAGRVLLRIRYSPDWRVTSGAACLTRSGPSWMSLSVPGRERVTLDLSVLGGGPPPCRAGPVAGRTGPGG